MATMLAGRLAREIEVAYVTDVEGNLDYFDRWVARSSVLKYTEPDVLDFTHDSAYFVFGGDAMDRGDGGMRFTRRLVALKKRYPSRVFLLAGNRDLNKVRFTSEFSESDLKRDPRDIPGPHWDPKAPTLYTYLSEVAEARGEPGGASAVDSRTERMHYYLRHTLGCPNTFEGRRHELAVLGEAAEPVSDTAVVDSLIADILPGGVLRSYLEHACIACVLGNTIFVHGAIDANAVGLVPDDGTRFFNPPAPQPMRRVHDVHEWVGEMNGVLQRGLAANIARPDWDASRTTRGGEVLMAMQNRCAMYGRTLVSSCYADGGTVTSPGAPAARAKITAGLAESGDALLTERWLSDPRDTTVADWLLRAGIRRIVVGHKPSGDSPAVLSAAATGVEVISADTSYADPNDRLLGRGVSLAGVSILGPSLAVNHARIYGTLADGREHDAHLATLDGRGRHYDTPGDDEIIGTETQDGWWVKARAAPSADDEGKKRYVCSRGAGRTVEQRDVLVSDL